MLREAAPFPDIPAFLRRTAGRSPSLGEGKGAGGDLDSPAAGATIPPVREGGHRACRSHSWEGVLRQIAAAAGALRAVVGVRIAFGSPSSVRPDRGESWTRCRRRVPRRRAPFSLIVKRWCRAVLGEHGVAGAPWRGRDRHGGAREERRRVGNGRG